MYSKYVCSCCCSAALKLKRWLTMGLEVNVDNRVDVDSIVDAVTMYECLQRFHSVGAFQ